MKKTIFIVAFILTTGSLIAQETEPIDKQEETTTKVTKVRKNGKVVKENKVQVTTRKEQKVRSKVDSSHYENSNRLKTPVKISQQVNIDSDNDPFFEDSKSIQYYSYKGKTYAFEPNEKGFTMNTQNSSENSNWGQARKSQSRNFYLVNMGNNSGVGYFGENGKFIVEYYDKTLNSLVIETFMSSEM